MRSRGWLLLLMVTASLTGCSPSGSTTTAVPAALPVNFGELFATHFAPPERFDNLNGLALYNTATEVPGHDSGGRFVVYALINNRDPLQGVLVGTHTPLSLGFFRERRNTSTMVSGSFHVLKDPEIVTWFVTHHGIHLATDDRGQPYWIDGTEAPTAIPAAARTPRPSATTPHPPAAPRGKPTPEENEPFDRELVMLNS